MSKLRVTWERRRGTSSREAYLQHIIRQNTAANGVFGAVVMWSYFEPMLQMLQEIPAYNNLNGAQLLATVLSTPKYIWMRRRNHVEQAVSWEMACRTGVWAQGGKEEFQPRPVPKFDFKAIDEWCKRIAAHEAGWENYFRENQIEPLVLFYEDVVASHRTAAERVLEFLQLPIPPGMEIPPPTIEKQATRISQEWTERYLKLKRKKTNRLTRIIERMHI